MTVVVCGRPKKSFKVRFDLIMIANEFLILRHLTASTLRIAPVYFYSRVSTRKNSHALVAVPLCLSMLMISDPTTNWPSPTSDSTLSFISLVPGPERG